MKIHSEKRKTPGGPLGANRAESSPGESCSFLSPTMNRRNREKKQEVLLKKSPRRFTRAAGKLEGKARREALPEDREIEFPGEISLLLSSPFIPLPRQLPPLPKLQRSFIYLLQGMRKHVRDRNEIFNK